MGHGKAGPNDRSIWRTAGQLAISVEDRFRFTLVVCFLALGFLGSGALFYLSDSRAQKFNLEAARVAVQRWNNRVPNLYEDIFGKTSGEIGNAPTLLDSNRVIPKDLLPRNLIMEQMSQVTHTNGEIFWLINVHPLIKPEYSLVLSESDYPELRIARESMQFQRWLIGTLLVTLIGAYAALFLFNKHFIFRPLRILREALLSRRLTDVARFRQSKKSKIVIERLEEKSRFPLEQFDSDEFGQIASILSEQDEKQKNNRLNWTKSFNTVDEPIAVFGADGLLRHCNTAMEKFFDDLEVVGELMASMSAESFLTTVLQVGDESKEKILRVINQDHPKITSQPCMIEAPEGPRSYRYSIATLNTNGERFAVLAMIRDQSANNMQLVEDIILEHSNVQMKLVHKMKSTISQNQETQSEKLLSICEALVDNMHGLLEESNNASLATHTNRIEFNLFQFLSELQVSLDNHLGVQLNIEKNCPSFVFGFPTHLRQLIKGIVHGFKESNPAAKVQMDIAYDGHKKGLNISLVSFESITVTRNPSLSLFLSHYNPIMELHALHDEELNPNEFSRVFVSVAASKTQTRSMNIKLSSRELPDRLIFIGDKDEHPEMSELFLANPTLKKTWHTVHELRDLEFFQENTCAVIVTGINNNLKNKATQQAISHLRSRRVPMVLASDSPRRGETITALRLGFVAYLTFPVDNNEFNKLLMLTMNKTLRERTQSSGLLTKHTVRDLLPSVGNVLIGVFSEQNNTHASGLTRLLQEMGYSVELASHVHTFFELLHKRNYEYIICSNEISSGLKRRIQVSTKGTPCLLFGPQLNPELDKQFEPKGQQSAQSWINIDIPTQSETIKIAFLDAANALAARVEGRSTNTENRDEYEEDGTSSPDPLNAAS